MCIYIYIYIYIQTQQLEVVFNKYNLNSNSLINNSNDSIQIVI